MAECSVCRSQDVVFVKGVSKKTGKPWSAYKCQEEQCGNLDFQKTQFKPTTGGQNNANTASTDDFKKQVLSDLALIKQSLGIGPKTAKIEEEPF